MGNSEGDMPRRTEILVRRSTCDFCNSKWIRLICLVKGNSYLYICKDCLLSAGKALDYLEPKATDDKGMVRSPLEQG